MKKILFILLCFYMDTAIAQSKLPSYGKIDKADLEMTDCDFDKGAPAIKLIHYGKMYYDRGTAGVTLFKTVYEYRVRIKILKDKGLSYANVEIPFYSYDRDEDIPFTDACTYNLDESGKVKVTAVSKSSVYTKKINKQYSRIIIAFPEVKVGSVIEYKYRLVRDNHLSIKDWYFQDQIPTRYSEYETLIPSRYNFNHQKFIVGNLDEKNSETDEVVNVGSDAYSFKMVKTNYVMHDLVGIKTVPFMGAVKDYLQRIEFSLKSIEANGASQAVSTSWTDIARDLLAYEDFGVQLSKEIHDLDPIISQAKLIADKNEKIRFLFNRIRSAMTCIDDEGIFTEEGVVKAWTKKSGNIAEINFILINALNKAGVRAAPILLSTRDNGLVNKLYRSEKQFNTIMAYVPLDENVFLVLDASDKVSNYRLAPGSIVNTSGLIVEGLSANWVDVLDNNRKYKMMIALQAVIDDKGMMKGECSISSMDYAKAIRANSFKKNADNFKQRYFIKPYPDVSIEEITVKDADTDSLPFAQKITFNMPMNSSGEYRYFNTNMFNDFESNPFIDDERASDVDFGFMQEYLIYCNFTLPQGYVFDALPKNISMSLPDKSIEYTRIMNQEENILNIRINIDFKTSFYPADKYGAFHDFYKKLLSSLNEQVVIKKK